MPYARRIPELLEGDLYLLCSQSNSAQPAVNLNVPKIKSLLNF